MIAPVDVRFFNKDWKALGDKRTLAPTLSRITRVPQHILTDRFSPNNRPCAAQIMSWAADRTTGEVEDKAYSLFGLLGVNIPVMYGEGKEAFRRLQLEFVREANDGSIFAWGFHRDSQRSGSILADDPSFFRGCENMELITPDEYLRHHRFQMPQLWLMPYIRRDRYDPWVMTNRGIQCRTFLRPCVHSRLHFETPLPCRFGPLGPPVSIKLALWKDDFYRYFTSLEEKFPTKPTLLLGNVCFAYEDSLFRDAIQNPHREFGTAHDITATRILRGCFDPLGAVSELVYDFATSPLHTTGELAQGSVSSVKTINHRFFK